MNARRENAIIKQGIAFSSKNLVYKSKKQKKINNKNWTYHRTAAGEMKSCQVDWYTRQQSIYSSSITDHKNLWQGSSKWHCKIEYVVVVVVIVIVIVVEINCMTWQHVDTW